MKISSFIFIILLIISCNQGHSRKSDTPLTLTVDTIRITDSMPFKSYLVIADTAYFFAKAEPFTKMNSYLTKNQLTTVSKINNEFAYAVLLTDSITYPLGWLQLKKIKKILFTPPKINKE